MKKNKKEKITINGLASIIRYKFQDIADLGFSGNSVAKAFDKELNYTEKQVAALIKKYMKLK